MIAILATVFIIAWFVFWGWMFATRPDTAFKFNEMGQQNLRRGASGVGKAIRLGSKLLKK